MLCSQTHTNICRTNKSYDTPFNSKRTFLCVCVCIQLYINCIFTFGTLQTVLTLRLFSLKCGVKIILNF